MLFPMFHLQVKFYEDCQLLSQTGRAQIEGGLSALADFRSCAPLLHK